MFRAILNNLLSSIGKICYTKAVKLANLPSILFDFLGELRGLPISFILIYFTEFRFSSITRIVIIGVFISIGICTLINFRKQKIYTKEKLSNILPYSNLQAVFSIIAGFLLFRDASVFSFSIAIITFLVILAFSIDFKKLTFPKTIGLILLIQLLGAIDTLITGRFLKSLSDAEFYVAYELLVLIILFFPIIKNRFYKKLKGIEPVFYGYRFGGTLMSHIGRILYLFTVGNLGIVMSVLLSFLGTGITMLFGWLFLKEIPTKKNIYMCLIVAALVTLGFLVG